MSGSFSKRLRRWAAALLLPGLVLRALIPVGFMPMFGANHGIQLVVCDGYAASRWAASTQTMDMPMDAAMHMSHNLDRSGGGSPDHQDHGSCPYGSSPALAAFPTFACLPGVLPRTPEPLVAYRQIVYFEVPPRAQTPRGPPA